MAVCERNAATVAFYAAASRVAIIALLVLSNMLLPTHDASEVHKFRPITFPVPGRPAAGGLLAAFTRWDAAWFLSIAGNGYPNEQDVSDIGEAAECSRTERAWGGEAYAQEVTDGHAIGDLDRFCRDDVPLMEQAHAFFPLYPWVVRWVAAALRAGLLLTGFLLGETNMLVLAAVVVSNACFVAAAVLLYHLGVVVTHDSLLAFRGALAFCATPAGVFFSTAYTESVFAALTFAGLLVLFTESRNRKAGWECGNRSALSGVFSAWVAAVLLSMATLTRSNGVTGAGVFVLEKLRWMADDAGLFLNAEREAMNSSRRSAQGYERVCGGEDKATTFKSQMVALPWPRLFACAISTFFQALLVMAPYAFVQVHAYHKFCGRGGQFRPGGSGDVLIHAWCSWRVPSLYAYVQSTYWGVGALKYYRWKQIPNFLLAAPALLLTATGTATFFSAQLQPSWPSPPPSSVKEGGEQLSLRDRTGRRWLRCLTWMEHLLETFFGVPGTRHAAANPFERTGAAALVLQWAFLGSFAAVCMNVQVTTRFLAAACPPLHWWTACLLFPEDRTVGRDATGSGTISACLRWYMGLYVIVGAVLHANFLPWT